MSSAKSLSVFRVEYEVMKDMSAWTAFIVAWSHEEALSTLARRVGPHHVMTSGFQSRVDAVSDEVRFWIAEKTLGKPKEKKAVEIKKVEKTEEPEENQPVVGTEKKVSLKRK